MIDDIPGADPGTPEDGTRQAGVSGQPGVKGQPGLGGGVATPLAIPAAPKRGFAVWRMGLVVSASALCGGIAVVLWNRRLLARMRELPPAGPAELYPWEDDT